MERKLRISALKDYIAVDIMQDGKTIETPFYVTPKNPVKVKVQDFENKVWVVGFVHFDGEKIKVVEDDFEWDCEPKDLLDHSQFSFYPANH